jgi:hypothetical protein
MVGGHKQMTGKHGVVVLFISGLPESIAPDVLRLKFQNLLQTRRHWGFSSGGSIGSCDIVRIVDLNSEEVEFHALVEIQPAKFALQAIKMLDGCLIDGHKLEVRRYNHRSSFRERRVDGSGKMLVNAANDRAGDRRRDGLRIELVEWRSTPRFPSLGRIFHPFGALKGARV